MVHIEGSTVRLTGEAVIHCAEELHAELSKALVQLAHVEGPIVIDVTGLEALDVLGAQMLIAAQTRLQAQRVHFVGWPTAIATFLTTSGLTAHFD